MLKLLCLLIFGSIPAFGERPIIGYVGGVVGIKVPKDTLSVSFNQTNQLLFNHTAIVALPLDLEDQSYSLSVESKSGSQQIPFLVKAKNYPEQRLTIKNQKYVEPSKNDLERIRKEQHAMKNAYRHVSAIPTDLRPFLQPIEGTITSLFGFRRILNGLPRNPHSGLDIAAPRGTKIKTPAPGKVILTGDFFFNGNTILIDHGGGLITMVCHLDEIYVESNEELSRSSVIGTVGSTGRATGPHLHWSVSLQGHRIDPQSFMNTINSL